MFLCMECHKKSCDMNHLFKSRGACEDCGKISDCYDCKIHHDKKEVSQVNMDGIPVYVVIEEQIRKAITEYYIALDNRKHGGVAIDIAFKKIEQLLDMSWSKHK